MEKLQQYQGTLGRIHTIRDNLNEEYQKWREQRTQFFKGSKSPPPSGSLEEQYSHIHRKKTQCELIRVSAAVMGIEFSYAAETAFVSPTLLSIGVDRTRMTMIWALSPLVGLICTPILGSLSDKCSLKFGRRRPFIILLSLGILIGLILVPNGKEIGKKLGDDYTTINASTNPFPLSNNTNPITEPTQPAHPWGVLFTVIGTILLDFDADACQSPSRAYLLDVTIAEDHAKGLSTFTVMAGLGGFFGYALGGINWDGTYLGDLFGGHVKAVFSLITVIFVICVTVTLTSFKEVPLHLIESTDIFKMKSTKDQNTKEHSGNDPCPSTSNATENVQEQDTNFSNTVVTEDVVKENVPSQNDVVKTVPPKPKGVPKITPESINNEHTPPKENVTYGTIDASVNEGHEDGPRLVDYLISIIFMPRSLLILCLTNLFCWMAHVSYSLNFTDYVGASVFGGDPKALEGTIEYELYEKGVRFGCWGMSMYSLSCCCYSLVIEKLIKLYRAKPIYVGGLMVYGIGMVLMAVLNSKLGVILFSCTAGVLYSTLFTMPYLLVANYHSRNMFDIEGSVHQKRGLGTDIAIVSSMVFFAQFMLSLCVGYVISIAGTTTVIVYASALFGILGSLSATQVLYLDL